jgi:hypothetical protein
MDNTGTYETPAGLRPGDASSAAGEVQFDDRGNAIWKPRQGMNGDEALRRLLDHSPLSLVPDDADAQRTIGANPNGISAGYDPLNSGQLQKEGWREKKDLRRLSAWIVANRPKDE